MKTTESLGHYAMTSMYEVWGDAMEYRATALRCEHCEGTGERTAPGDSGGFSGEHCSYCEGTGAKRHERSEGDKP